MKKLSLILFVIAWLIAVPGTVLAMGLVQEPSFTIPEVFQIALLGFVTYWIIEGLKLLYPPLTGVGPRIAAILVSGLLAYVTGLINAYVNPIFYNLIADIFVVLAIWLTATGIKRFELNLRRAILLRAE